MEDQTEKRLRELAERAWSRGIPCCTDFLDLSAQTVLRRIQKTLAPAELRLFGGAEGCERQMAGFGLASDADFPIVCLRIQPTGMKFAEELGHRDVLGALMSLGFERSLLGDIVVREKEAWVFCVARIARVIEESLLSVRRTSVRCFEVPSPPAGELFRTERRVVQVASERMDALVAHAFRLSRGNAQSLFPAGKVFLDGAECLSPDAVPEEGQIVSVRGLGRFRFVGAETMSKKGKLNSVIEMYV